MIEVERNAKYSCMLRAFVTPVWHRCVALFNAFTIIQLCVTSSKKWKNSLLLMLSLPIERIV